MVFKGGGEESFVSVAMWDQKNVSLETSRAKEGRTGNEIPKNCRPKEGPGSRVECQKVVVDDKRGGKKNLSQKGEDGSGPKKGTTAFDERGT